MLLPGLPRPSVAVTVGIFLLTFDFAHDRNVSYPALLIVLGRPFYRHDHTRLLVAWLPVSPLIVVLVFAYMHLFKFRSTTGRQIFERFSNRRHV